MKEQYLYFYKKTNQARAKLFVIFGVLSLILSLAPYIFQSIIDIPDTFFILTIVFTIVSIALFSLAWINYNNPLEYESIVTKDKLIIKYPNDDSLSFSVNIKDIKAFENRPSDNIIGKEKFKSGIVLKNGYFYHICTKYDNNVEIIFSAVKSINPNVSFK